VQLKHSALKIIKIAKTLMSQPIQLVKSRRNGQNVRRS